MGGRLLAISDLHVGYPENRAFALSLRPADPGDWLIVAGDVGEIFADVGYVLATLADRFARVIWTPGNHELWTLPSDPVALRGVARYEALVTVCRRFGVLTPEDDFPVWPGPDGPVTVAPLFTLFDYSFTFAPDGAGARAGALDRARAAGLTCADEERLHPDPYPSPEAWCQARVAASAARLAGVPGPVVLVSHWPLLRAPAEALRHPEFAPWCGTELTDGWHRSFPVTAAVYGHLHIPRTTFHDGVRFEEVSVGYPREWRRRGASPPLPRVILGGLADRRQAEGREQPGLLECDDVRDPGAGDGEHLDGVCVPVQVGGEAGLAVGGDGDHGEGAGLAQRPGAEEPGDLVAPGEPGGDRRHLEGGVPE